MEILFLILSFCSFIILGIILFLFLKKDVNKQQEIDRIADLLKESRLELANSLKDNREELTKSLHHTSERLDDRLLQLIHSQDKKSKEDRQELSQSIKDLQQVFRERIKEMAVNQEVKLEKIRETVDEKLHKTLEERLGRSFKMVSERLEAVQKGLGEMQSLANGVGDLKKVLSNVKTRGILGEIQLGNILEQILAPQQYIKNAKIKNNTSEFVEFAVKFPGKEGGMGEVLLPIDAKFPQEDFIRLQDAYMEGNVVLIEESKIALIRAVKSAAKLISQKYIDPPNTTDFAILFLPVEGLFAEVVRQPDLITLLQQEYKIIVTGPTTLAAMLNSFQMGFKTLSIQKRSSEVWKILSAVKSEFNKFGGVLEKTQKKINEANKELDTLVGTRTRLMLSKLKDVEAFDELTDKQSIKE